MSAPANCKLVGRWRIVKADIWDRDHLDLCGPATITITDHGRGEIAFGALQAGLDIEYSRLSVGFTWEGCDGEMDRRVSGGRLWLNCSMTAPSRSNSPITTATKPSSKPNEGLLQQPARASDAHLNPYPAAWK